MKKISRLKLAKAFVALANSKNQGDLLVGLAQELISSHRVSELPLMVQDINRELLAQKGHLEATVISAHTLDPDVMHEVEQELKNRTGAKTVRVKSEQDASLVGGIVAETPDEVIDLSLKYKLQQLET